MVFFEGTFGLSGCRVNPFSALSRDAQRGNSSPHPGLGVVLSSSHCQNVCNWGLQTSCVPDLRFALVYLCACLLQQMPEATSAPPRAWTTHRRRKCRPKRHTIVHLRGAKLQLPPSPGTAPDSTTRASKGHQRVSLLATFSLAHVTNIPDLIFPKCTLRGCRR